MCFLIDVTCTYCDLLHENRIGGFRLVQKSVHVGHTFGSSVKLLTKLFFGRLNGPHKRLWESGGSRSNVKPQFILVHIRHHCWFITTTNLKLLLIQSDLVWGLAM